MRRSAGMCLVLVGCGRFGFGSSQSRDAANDALTLDVADAAPAICHSGTWGTPQPIASTLTGSEEADPSISSDDLTLYFESNRNTSQGRALWMTTRTTPTDPFGTPVLLAALDFAGDEFDPAITGTGLVLYFASDQLGGRQIFTASRATTGVAFAVDGPIALLNDVQSPRYGTSLSSGELVMYFSRDLEVAVATRATTTDDFSFVREIDEVNVSASDGSPSATDDGLELFFDSYRTGPAAIFTASRASTSDMFSNLTELTTLPAGNLGAGAPEISHDGRTLYYWINVGGELDLYTVTRTCD